MSLTVFGDSSVDCFIVFLLLPTPSRNQMSLTVFGDSSVDCFIVVLLLPTSSLNQMSLPLLVLFSFSSIEQEQELRRLRQQLQLATSPPSESSGFSALANFFTRSKSSNFSLTRSVSPTSADATLDEVVTFQEVAGPVSRATEESKQVSSEDEGAGKSAVFTGKSEEIPKEWTSSDEHRPLLYFILCILLWDTCLADSFFFLFFFFLVVHFDPFFF